MRLPTALSLRAVLPAAALAFAPALYGVPAYAAGAQPATCGDRNATDFPIEAHLRDGPDQYARGGGWRGWHLELRNATDTGCRAIHPIAVLVDQAHELRPRHIGFEFLDPYAEGGATWRTVSFEATDEDENIGVFDDHFKGFTVPAHKTVDVQVRTRFTADAPEGPVTANAIAVQRRADDGDWVGQSNDYQFRVGGAATATGAGTRTGAGTSADPGTRTRAATRTGRVAGTDTDTDTGTSRGTETADAGDSAAAAEGDAETKPAPPPTTRSKSPTATPTRTPDKPRPSASASASPSDGARSPGASHKESRPPAVPPRADSDVDADTEADADVDAEADVDTDPSAETDTGTGADADTGTGTGSDTELGADTDTDMDTDLGADTGAGSDTGTDTDTGLDSDVGADVDAGTETDTGTDTGTDEGLDTGTDLGADAGTDADLGTDTGLGTDTEDPSADTDLGTESDLGTDTDLGTGADPSAESDLGTGTDPGTGTDAGRDPQATDPGTGTGSDGRHEKGGDREHERQRMPELAATGRHTALFAGLGVISAALVTCGTVLVVKSRRSGA